MGSNQDLSEPAGCLSRLVASSGTDSHFLINVIFGTKIDPPNTLFVMHSLQRQFISAKLAEAKTEA